MRDYAQAVRAMLARIATAERLYGRPDGSVNLLAVSKSQSSDAIRSVFATGLHRFGESYLQEALPKIASLSDCPIEWHFIGPIQSNKTRGIAEHFAWVHSIDSTRIARRLNDQRPEARPPLNICIEVNIGAEAGKSGVTPAAVPDLVAAVGELPRLRIRGLMTVPPISHDLDVQRRFFRQLRELHDELAAQGLPLDTLSMGMTDDLEAAIAEGATIVRIGSGIFGKRSAPDSHV